MPDNWTKFAVDEIERSTKLLTRWEKDFMASIKKRLDVGFCLTSAQEKRLLDLHEKMTDISRRV